MKTILYMATTIDGFVAKKDDNTDFVSGIEWDSFRAMMKRVRNIIIGRKTFELMEKGDELPNLDEVAIVVVTRNNSFSVVDSRVKVVSSPRRALDFLIGKNFKEALVAGGGAVNASFMEQKLVDEIYLDVEPVALGDGIKLFSGKAFELKLRLLGIKYLSENELQLHYRVIHKK